MSRRQAREAALKVLFQMDFNPPDSEHASADAVQETIARAIRAAVEEKPFGGKEDMGYAMMLAVGAWQRRAEIDAKIQETSTEWKVPRMAGTDRNACRVATYEMFFSKERIDAGVAINEAVELAKKYGTEDSGRFVNGILGAMARGEKGKVTPQP